MLNITSGSVLRAGSMLRDFPELFRGCSWIEARVLPLTVSLVFNNTFLNQIH